jgi:hypothetical protein
VYDETHRVGEPRFASDFEQIDDPGALSFEARYIAVQLGGIVCLRNTQGYLLLQLIGIDLSMERSSAEFGWEARGVSS